VGNLWTVSLFTLGILLSFVFLIIVLVSIYLGNLNLGVAIFLTIGINALLWLISPWFSDFIYKWFYKARFLSREEVEAQYPDAATIMAKISSRHHYNFPKFAVIDDLNPTAFSYGSGRWNARVVVTQGIFKYLNRGEVQAVVAHEMGHVTNRDFIVMMIGTVLVQILYEAYAVFARTRSRDDKKSGLVWIGLLAFVLYFIGTYLLLFLSRTREYLADEFSARSTGKPQDLANGLIKIAYGIVTAEDSDSAKHLLHTTRHLGLIDVDHAKDTAALSMITGNDPMKLAEVMVFDRISPWAKLVELNSTHPLTGRRIDRMSKISKTIGAAFSFDVEAAIARLQINKSRLYSDFSVGLLFFFAPWGIGLAALAAFFLGIANIALIIGLGLIILGLVYLLQTFYMYPGGEATETTVLSEMRNPYASPIKGKKIALPGEVIGRGTPGYIFGADLMFQDRTGLVFLKYLSAIPLLGNLLFALTKLQNLIGRQGVAEGWFFRAMSGYVSLAKVQAGSDTFHSYPRVWSLIGALLLVGIGLLVILASAASSVAVLSQPTY
jgi:Zn-dependent protease with chaperone function